MITVLSRYEREKANQDPEVVSAIRKPVDKVSVQLYTVKYGDTLELLATKIYGDPTQYWRIADINPQIKFPTDLVVGARIRIPQ